MKKLFNIKYLMIIVALMMSLSFVGCSTAPTSSEDENDNNTDNGTSDNASNNNRDDSLTNNFGNFDTYRDYFDPGSMYSGDGYRDGKYKNNYTDGYGGYTDGMTGSYESGMGYGSVGSEI